MNPANKAIKDFWGQKVLDLGDRWRTNIHKLFIQAGKPPRYSVNGKLLRAAQAQNVRAIEIAFPERQYVITKTPEELLSGEKILKVYNQPDNPMDFYYHEVDAYFPREGKKKEVYQAVGQGVLI